MTLGSRRILKDVIIILFNCMRYGALKIKKKKFAKLIKLQLFRKPLKRLQIFGTEFPRSSQ